MKSHPSSDPNTDQPAQGRKFGRRWLSYLGIGLLLLGVLMVLKPLYGAPRAAPLPPASAARPAASSAPARPAPAPVPDPSSLPPAAPAPAPAQTSLGFSPPTRLQIPSIGVDAPFTELALDNTGVLNAPPPDNRNLVGWYKGSATPGESGNSVVVGHVDTTTGPAVFMRLSSLERGSTVDITRADGVTAKFVVDSVQAFPKNQFPDQEVYGDTPDPQLRLITCGGPYDKSAGGYTENAVVFAHLDSWGNQE
ncbi:class F sortase [Kitasatospora sp. GP82]|uniref:class F sortase n=1 Tax=Kitasatospora sp. GP82 TaxID=3035089 RepID=UPI002476F033|nr:class F sortase [Kitasatospora sp. GP82]MDH6125423.1 LPXTG-site transpeptidase (sortase) family protein [Kitasatospora sp. GP82]